MNSKIVLGLFLVAVALVGIIAFSSHTTEAAPSTTAKPPKSGATCKSGENYCETRSGGAREKTCVCTGTPAVCTWSDWNGCGKGATCDKEGDGGKCEDINMFKSGGNGLGFLTAAHRDG